MFCYSEAKVLIKKQFNNYFQQVSFLFKAAGIGVGSGTDHVSLKIKRSFYIDSSLSSFTTFCVMATKITIHNNFHLKKCSCFTEIAAQGCLANHVLQERKRPFHVSRQINIPYPRLKKIPYTPPPLPPLLETL